LSLGACSLINHFDDVKPGTTGGSTGGPGTSSSTTTSTGSAGTGAGGDTPAGAGGGTSVTSGGGSATGGAGPTGGAGGGTAGSGTGGSATDSGVADVRQENAPPRVLQCRFTIGSATGGHRKLDDYSTFMGGDRTLADKFFMLPVGNGTTVRILTQLKGQQNNYLEYFASDGGGVGTVQNVYSGGRLVDAHKIDLNSSGALFISTDMHPPELVLHKFDDANQNWMPAVIQLTNPGDLGGSGNVEASFSPAPDGTIALAMSFQPMTGMPVTQAAFGLYRGGMLARVIPLFTDPNSDNARPTGVVRMPGAENYAFYGQSPQIQYEVRDTAATVTDTNHRTVPGTAFIITSGMDAAGKLNLVAADLGTAMMPSLKLLVGQADLTQAFTFDPTTFVLAKNAASLADVPVGSLSGLTDDMLLFAGPTGFTRKELSVWFVDIWGQTRVEQKLADTMGEVSNGIAAPRGMIGSANNKWHIAWSETMTDAGGVKYDILWYDQIECL
jgi:hypothetical protein